MVFIIMCWQLYLMLKCFHCSLEVIQLSENAGKLTIILEDLWIKYSFIGYTS